MKTSEEFDAIISHDNKEIKAILTTESELARLLKIEAAARKVIGHYNDQEKSIVIDDYLMNDLKEALEQK